ncbi:MAG: DNA modification methylase [Dehalococcoidia bacterium]|nr:DNA modification methylase [Dehalococcoidia bacterium]
MDARKSPQVEWVPLAKLTPNPANPRHNDDAVPHVAASIRRFGWQQPIVAKRSGEVVAGHTRLKAAQLLGLDEVPVAWFDGSDLDAAAFGIADNRTHEFATWDDAALSRILDELRREDALDGVGYSTDDIDALLAELEAGAGDPGGGSVDDPGPQEPPPTPTTRAGDLWILGDHRLLCGDSTNAADVDRVLDGRRAALIATDPPYVVDYTGERPNDSGKDWTALYKEVEITDAEGFFRSVFEQVQRVAAPKAAIYCWHAHKRHALITRIWEELGILDHQQIVWVKPTAVFGRVYWHFRHEPCLMGWIQGSKPDHDGHHEFNSVWEVDWDGKARVVGNAHPTEKPAELFARPMRKHTKPGDVCFEPFSGSGSQIIAAERERRRCCAIEVQPAFVDAAIVRWQKATGVDATLDGDGRTFVDVADERAAATANEGVRR